MAAGDFSVAKLCDINVDVEEAFLNDQSPLAREVMGFNPASAVKIKEDSDANTNLSSFFFTNGIDKTPDVPTIDVTFIKSNVTSAAFADNCTITGTRTEAAKKQLQLSLGQEVNIAVRDLDFQNSKYTKEQAVAKQLLAALKKLDDWWNTQSITFLKANQGAANTNSLLTNWTWDAVNKKFTVASANYTTRLAAELILFKELNGISDSYILESGNLAINTLNAKIDAGNCCGTGDSLRVDVIDAMRDVQGFAKAGVTEDLYHITAGSIGFVTFNYYDSTPTEINASGMREIRYTIPSPKIPGVSYDVRYAYTCVSGRNFEHVWKIATHGGFVTAPQGDLFPQGGTVKDTGIVAIEKV